MGLTSRSDGRFLYRFTSRNGNRRTVHLGRINGREADRQANHLDALVSAHLSSQPLDKASAAWLADLDHETHKRLADVGLVDSRQPAEVITLGRLVNDFVADHSASWKPRTKVNTDQAHRFLFQRFDPATPIININEADAHTFARWLKPKLSQATAARHLRRVQQLFTFAVRKRWLPRSPFDDLKCGEYTNKARQRFIDRDTIDKVIDAAPDADWQLMIALSRFGGLRAPSEILALKWSDIDWQRGRITVHSPKTEHHGPEHASRVIPLFRELRSYLDDAFAVAPEGAEFVIRRYRGKYQNIGTQFRRIIRKAGVEPWPKRWHNLRASRQTELMQEHPAHVVCKWLGNSLRIAEQHYLQVTDADFDKAISGGYPTPENAGHQNGHQQRPETARTGSQANQPVCWNATTYDSLRPRANVTTAQDRI